MPHLNTKGVLSFLKRDINSPYKIKKFADKLKDIVCILLGCTRNQLENREFKEKELGEEWDRIISSDGKIHLPDDYPDLEYSKLTPRLLLQLLGTEAGRNIIHPNIWCNSLFSDYKSGGFVNVSKNIEVLGNFPNWIITDLRFPNEMEAVKKRHGITIRVNRKLQPGKINFLHQSETALDKAKFDYILENNGTLDDLIRAVKQILIIEKVI